MFKLLTSLSFLYAFSIAVLFLYGYLYYKSFIKNGYQKRRFPLVFLLISLACFSFLYFNMHAPLSLKTFSNLDHHFIRHDGFRVAGRIELGRTDTVNYKGNSFNRFLLSRENSKLVVNSAYAEEPFYTSSGNSYTLLSVTYPAAGQRISFAIDSNLFSVTALADTGFQLTCNGTLISRSSKQIKKGLPCWAIFKDDIVFINSPWYTHEKVTAALKNILLLRDNVSRNKAGELKYFVSGRIFQLIDQISYNDQPITRSNLAFKAIIEDKATLAWGIGFLDNNRNQFRVNYGSADSFTLLNRYPVSYPLSEEDKGDWNKHSVNKFLVADGRDITQMPAVFSEGFLFAPFDGDSTIDFSPVLLTYQKIRPMRHWPCRQNL